MRAVALLRCLIEESIEKHNPMLRPYHTSFDCRIKLTPSQKAFDLTSTPHMVHTDYSENPRHFTPE